MDTRKTGRSIETVSEGKRRGETKGEMGAE